MAGEQWAKEDAEFQDLLAVEKYRDVTTESEDEISALKLQAVVVRPYRTIELRDGIRAKMRSVENSHHATHIRSGDGCGRCWTLQGNHDDTLKKGERHVFSRIHRKAL